MDHTPPTLPYANPNTTPKLHRPYGLASIAVFAGCAAWFVLSYVTSFSPSKQDRIGQVASSLGVILGFASLRRNGPRPRLGTIGIFLNALSLAAFVLLPTL
jgi:hypothetical protein